MLKEIKMNFRQIRLYDDRYVMPKFRKFWLLASSELHVLIKDCRYILHDKWTNDIEVLKKYH